MSGILRWEEPPIRTQNDWQAIADDLVNRPGAWALAVVCPNTSTAASTARHIREGKYDAMQAGFEAKARTVDGEARVYARYIGEGS